MGVRYEYTQSHNMPVIAVWRCSKCNCANSSYGNIVYQAGSSTKSGSNARHEEIKKDLSDRVDREWLPHAFGIIRDPVTYYKELRHGLYLANYKCRQCNNKEVWSRKEHVLLEMIPIFGLLFSLVALIYDLKSMEAWIFAVVFLGLTILACNADKIFGKNLKKVPESSLPKIVTTDEDLNQYAESHKYNIFTEEAMVIFNEANPNGKQNNQSDNPVPVKDTTIKQNESNTSPTTGCQCPNCKNTLPDGSVFCSYCGTKIE